MKEAALNLIEGTRQTGNTTHLAQLASETGGTLIVADHRAARFVRSIQPTANVLTLPEMSAGVPVSAVKAPIFFDNSAIRIVANHSPA